MYAHIRGIVDELAVDRVVLDASGVGYEIFCSANTLRQLQSGAQAKLLVHFHLTQDAAALYGFLTAEERAMFRRLISVTRVGPKLALSILSTLSVSDIAMAVFMENAAAFDAVSGMGRKTAARVLLELKEKIDKDVMGGLGLKEAAGTSFDMRAEAVAALVTLGYDGVTAGRAVAGVEEAKSLEDMITLALRQIAQRGSK